MKNLFKVSAVLALVLILSVFLLPVLATSSNYSFDMRNTIVDGKKNNEFHYLGPGYAYISGSQYVYESVYPDANIEKLHFTLVKSNFGFDTTIGTITADNNSSISVSYGKIEDGKYYLQIWKANRDWHHTRGSGTLSN